MNFFSIVKPDLFKPLTSKYKETFLDCLLIIYRTYRDEMSFGVEKDVVLSELERYFEMAKMDEMVFEEEEEAASDARSQANAVIRKLRECGWIEYEQGQDYSVRINLLDYASTLLDTFEKIIRDDEMEYQSIIWQIYGTLLNKDAYIKPYEYIIKRTMQNTEELMKGLKKLNTNIRKHIEAITIDKTAKEIIDDFFVYQKDIGSKAYHRIKTSDNISYFRSTIQEKLYNILEDEEIFENAAKGYMLIEAVEEQWVAERELREMILAIIRAFKNYDDIVKEIDDKNTRYISSAVARAKFLLNNMNNVEGKLIQILNHLSQEMNSIDCDTFGDDADDELMQMFGIFPQRFIDGESLYTMPIKRNSGPPEILDEVLGMSLKEREARKEAQRQRDRKRFSRKNINKYMQGLFDENQKTVFRASELPLGSKRDMIRLIFISLYGRDSKAEYVVKGTSEIIEIEGYRFADFSIERKV